MTEVKRLKSINFDLDTQRLREVFGEGGRKKAYAQIQRFLMHNGFDHRQWSGYVSTEPMIYADIYLIIDVLTTRCPWLMSCTNRFDVTDFMAESDVLDYLVSKPRVASDEDLGAED
jgi:virulence-associated protein VapD